jgi:hypothetical protein
VKDRQLSAVTEHGWCCRHPIVLVQKSSQAGDLNGIAPTFRTKESIYRHGLLTNRGITEADPRSNLRIGHTLSEEVQDP